MVAPSCPKKTIYLGWSLARGNPRPWLELEVSHVMINAFDFLSRGRPESGRASEVLAFEGEIFCDSGGFQMLQSRRRRIPVESAIEHQRRLGARFNAALDDGLDPRRHLENFRAYLARSRIDPAFRFVPVIPHDLPPGYLDEMVRAYPDPPVVAVGKVVPALFPLADHERVLGVLRSIREIRRRYPDSRVHVFGLGGITTAAIFFHFVDSTDSSSWLHDARFGKLRMLGGGIARTTRPRSVRTFLSRQAQCECPSCRTHGSRVVEQRGIKGLRMRAVHNAWVSIEELKRLNQSLADRTFDDVVARRARGSTFHRKLYRIVRKFREQPEG